ncbi:hypothetical protein C8R44DRAFT_989790 [Mycena epipterygia]|nr:hypothetical protein C8R44DRAFT_989790 [Mycena epipterygia]
MADNPRYPEGRSSASLASSDSGPSPFSRGFITNSRDFTIAGGQFTNVRNCAPTIPADFRTIPLGDLDLRHEICLDGMVAKRKLGLPIARRIYSARVERKQSDMTVAVYQGANAEETWKRGLANYSGLRHPHIAQLYGAVNSGGLYALIFHDDLVPRDQFLEEYQQSVISTVYLYAQFNTELASALEYFQSLSGESYSAFLVSGIDYWLEFSETPEKIPEGYLFLCPVEHLRDDNGRWVPNPECPAYWSLDPSGNQRLSPEEASGGGFPAFKLEMDVLMKFWHESVYAALSRFHAGKGFDPNSQDLARHLGYPLYELSSPTNSAHIEELDLSASDDAMLTHDPSVHIEELDLNASDNAVATQDTPQPQKFRVIFLGCLGLILALMVSWSYSGPCEYNISPPPPT